jgi:glycosyltransferase XagB
MLDTTTWEEACSELPFWIRQRTRWLKGYIQTYLVHMRRSPWRLLRELGRQLPALPAPDRRHRLLAS